MNAPNWTNLAMRFCIKLMLLSFSGDLIYESLNMIDDILKLVPPCFKFLALALLLLNIIKHQSNRLQPCLKLLQQSIVNFMNLEEVNDFFGSQTVQQDLNCLSYQRVNHAANF